MSRLRRRELGVGGMTASLAATLCSCAAPAPTAAPPPSPARVEPAPPFALGGDEGLELRRWVYRLDAAALGRRLQEQAQPAPLSQEAASALRTLGLTLLRTPRADLLQLRDALGELARAERVWIAQSPAWRPLLSAPTPAAHTLVGDRVVPTPRGRPSLLVRTWVAPSADGPVVRLDLLAVDGLTGAAPLLASLTGDAASLTRLAAAPVAGAVVSIALEPGWAYLLAADAQTEAREAPTAEEVDPSSDDGPEALTAWPLPEARRLDRFGPTAPLPATVGQLLLTAVDAERRGADGVRCVVVALLPRTDGETLRLAP